MGEPLVPGDHDLPTRPRRELAALSETGGCLFRGVTLFGTERFQWFGECCAAGGDERGDRSSESKYEPCDEDGEGIRGNRPVEEMTGDTYGDDGKDYSRENAGNEDSRGLTENEHLDVAASSAESKADAELAAAPRCAG